MFQYFIYPSLLLMRRIIISMRAIRISIVVNDLIQKYDILIILMFW